MAVQSVVRRAAILLLAAAVSVVAACGGGSTDEPGGVDISSGSRHLNLVAYAAAKPAFDAVIPAFRQTEVGRDIGFSQSYGASGDQSRKVARRVPADIVNFSVTPDVTRLVDEGLVDEDWQKQYPNKSVPFGSVVVMVVRKGNPKNIRGWDDLLKPGVDVITPNPGSSGSAKWNLLAPYAIASNGGKNQQAGLDYLTKLISGHVRVAPKSGREATTTFEQGQGDVLLSYENEAIMMMRAQADSSADRQVEYFVPAQTMRIDNPVAVVNTTADRDGANEFMRYMFSAPGQRLWAKQGFRPTDPTVARETANLFPGSIDHLWTIDDLGGWKKVDKALFGKSGGISKIYSRGSR